MNAHILIALGAIVLSGFFAQWISWRFRLPSILLLLLVGFILGPGIDFLHPDEIFGKLLFPMVSVSVAIILFEGGLNLKLSELKSAGREIRNLLLIGIPVTWILSTIAGFYLLGLSFQLSLLLGAILVVTGPTVIMPILSHVRPTGKINSILKWEGISNDPIGAMFAVLVFETILASGIMEITEIIFIVILKTVVISSVIGIGAAVIMVILVKQKLIPDYLENAAALSAVIVVFVGSNLIQHESGLFAVTVMGIALANQKTMKVAHILEFKENLRLLLVTMLFIVLAARIEMSLLTELSLGAFLFAAVLILVVRPVSVFLSLIRSQLSFKEKFFIGWMAPRGIVAAAVTSLFAIELTAKGYPEAQALVAYIFLVIIATIAIYGLSSAPLAKILKLRSEYPQGCLIIGAYPFAREIGMAIKNAGFRVIMVDTNYENISAARMAGLSTYYGSSISENILEVLDLQGVGRLLAMTPNKEVNSLSGLHFSKIFKPDEVYQLSTARKSDKKRNDMSSDLKGNILFGTSCNYESITHAFGAGFKIKTTELTEKFGIEEFYNKYGREKVVPLFLSEKSKLQIYSNKTSPVAKNGMRIIALVKEENENEKPLSN